MIIWLQKLPFDIFVFEVCFQQFGGLVVHDIQTQVVALVLHCFEDAFDRINNFCVFETGNRHGVDEVVAIIIFNNIILFSC